MTEIEITGPNGIAVLPDGTFIVGDTFDNRLLRFDAAGVRLDDIDLASLGILNVSDIVAGPEELYLLEISFQVTPERYRVNRLTFDGQSIDHVDVPLGYRLEDGLVGLAQGEGQILLELAGPVRSYQMAGPRAENGGEFYGLPAFGRLYQTHYETPCGGHPSMTVGNLRFETGRTLGGGLGMLAVNPDGSFYAWRSDVIRDFPTIVTDQTIHYLDANGQQLAVARYPLSEWYFHLSEYLAVGPDGNVYALITRETSVDVLRLLFYQELEPLESGAAAPEVTSGTFPPMVDSRCDCSMVDRVPPDSEAARQIVGQLLANFKVDWPTEYMALDPLWAVDRMGDYALLQGRVTDEAMVLVLAQVTSRGYVMVTSHTVSNPGPSHSIIPDLLRAKAPDAPQELIYCADVGLFLGETE
ncbi:MAG TPA: hypothetical protein VFI11_00355 [Anaerolineales bacterium]|nr:hypothetical protein [Anaerolineales bacterium]